MSVVGRIPIVRRRARRRGQRPARALVVGMFQSRADVVLSCNPLKIRSSTADTLIELGCSVVESSAEEALRLLKRGLIPDIVATDHFTPGSKPVAATRIRRAGPRYHRALPPMLERP